MNKKQAQKIDEFSQLIDLCWQIDAHLRACTCVCAHIQKIKNLMGIEELCTTQSDIRPQLLLPAPGELAER